MNQTIKDRLEGMGISPETIALLEDEGLDTESRLCRVTDAHLKEMRIKTGDRLDIKREFPLPQECAVIASASSPAIITRSERVEDLIRQAAGGDTGAISRLRERVGSQRFLVEDAEGKMDIPTSIENWGFVSSSGCALPPGEALTPDEFFTEPVRHCPVDGSQLLRNRNPTLAISYERLSDEQLIELRLCLVCGNFLDRIAAVDQFIAGNRDGTYWRQTERAVTNASEEQKLAAKRFVLHRPGQLMGSVIWNPTLRDPDTLPQENDSGAISIWRERLEFFLQEEALCSDPGQKFSIGKRIEEARAKIKALS